MTYEHLPPRSAFNDKGILLHSFLYTDHPKHKSGGKKAEKRHARGVGFYTLCGKCNSDTGGLYGEDYLNWAQQAMSYIDVVETSQIIYVPFRIRPLNVMKQIVSMGLSGSTGGGQTHPDLARFVLNPQLRTFPHDYSCYVYLTNKKSEARFCNEMASLNIHTGAIDHILAEIALPPLGCAVVHENTSRHSEIKDKNLCSINHWARYDYNVWSTVYLRIPVHRIWSPTPLDYRKID